MLDVLMIVCFVNMFFMGMLAGYYRHKHKHVGDLVMLAHEFLNAVQEEHRSLNDAYIARDVDKFIGAQSAFIDKCRALTVRHLEKG